MNYRRNNRGNARALTALCVALAVLAAGMGAWGVVGQVRVSRLSARVAELEAGGATVSSPEGVAPAGEAGAADSDSDDIAAEFEGGVVTVGEARAEYETLASYYEMLGVEPEDYEDDAKMTVLSNLAESKILANKARELGLDELTDDERAEIEAQATADFEENVNYYMSFRDEEGKSEEEVRAETIEYLAENGSTLEGAIQEALQDATQQRLYDSVSEGLSVDDEQLRGFYDEQVESAEIAYTTDYSEYEMDVEAGRAVVWNPEGVRRVQAIQISFDADQSVEYLSLSAELEEGDADAEAKLDALYTALEPKAREALGRAQSGEDFAALMEEYGSLGPEAGCCVSELGSLYGEDFRDAAMALSGIGDLSDVVRSDGGLCVLRYASDVEPGEVPFEQVAEELRSGYEEELKLSQYNAAVVQWIEDANVKYYPERI